MKIATRPLGLGHAPVVIAEIGVNHDGDPARALWLVDAAADAGADAVKVQYFEADRLLAAGAPLAGYQHLAGETDARAMLRRLELAPTDLAAVMTRAHEHGLLGVCSVFTPELAAPAAELGAEALKVASPDLVNRLLVDALAATGLPLILSTGAATTGEVTRTLSWIPDAHSRLALMHCVSAYPTPPADASLGAIPALAALTGLPCGYSDHTDRTDTGGLAVAAGACVLEKHLTYAHTAPGPDHAASLEPPAFAEYVRGVRTAFEMLGTTEKAPRTIESDVRAVARQSLAAAVTLEPGQPIDPASLTTRRPGAGLPASDPDAVAGRRPRRRIEAGQIITADDLA